jgi:hypothetical protein
MINTETAQINEPNNKPNIKPFFLNNKPAKAPIPAGAAYKII